MAVITSLFFCMVLWLSMEHSATKKLLSKLELAIPGQKLSRISEKLGQQMHKFEKLDEVIGWGKVKDRKFCEGKILYWFYASTPPCRALEIYTDSNDIIVFSTVRGL